MFILDSGFLFFSVPDPGSNNKNRNRRRKKTLFYFFCSHKFTKLEQKIIFWTVLEKNLSQFTNPKMITKLAEYGLGIWNPEIIPGPSPGVKKPRSPDPVSQLWIKIFSQLFIWFLYHDSFTNGIGTNWFGNQLHRHSAQTISEQGFFSLMRLCQAQESLCHYLER